MKQPYSFIINNNSSAEFPDIELLNAAQNYENYNIKHVEYGFKGITHRQLLGSIVSGNTFKINRIVFEYFYYNEKKVDILPSYFEYTEVKPNGDSLSKQSRPFLLENEFQYIPSEDDAKFLKWEVTPLTKFKILWVLPRCKMIVHFYHD
ncbi:MAG: hypothetical protein PHW73_00165 [Atribacterota bacterium]|nr:hypothetical protein [Atribacterota bacterium]